MVSGAGLEEDVDAPKQLSALCKLIPGSVPGGKKVQVMWNNYDAHPTDKDVKGVVCAPEMFSFTAPPTGDFVIGFLALNYTTLKLDKKTT
jgi:hypothetical protein